MTERRSPPPRQRIRRGAGKTVLGRHAALALLLLGMQGAAEAREVGLLGLFPGKAVLAIDGGAPQTLAVGRQVNGVRLLQVEAHAATVEIDGRRERLQLGQHVYAAPSDNAAESVSLSADARGHFITSGTVNGASLRFMVDTGATAVALGLSDARRANIDLTNTRQVMVQTANGTVPAWLVTLDSVRLGAITLHQVAGVVHQQDLPVALLGMSFLNRMEMKRDGPIMTLRKRF